MRRVLALCTFGLALGGCDLDFGQNDQTNDGDADLPGEEYRQCVLGTLEQCDTDDLTPDACTALIAEQCNEDGGCDSNTMDPTGQCPPPCDQTDPMGCPPPPVDCFQQVFDDCVASGIDPMQCALIADQTCNPQCMPGDPNCEPCDPMTTNPDGSCPPPPCDPATGQMCCQPGDPNCEPPPPCDPTTGQNCCQPGDPNCEPPPPPCDPMTDPDCQPWPCNDPSDPNCQPPPPCDPVTDPMCEPQPCDNPMDPSCWPQPPDDPPTPGCQMGDPNCP